MTNRDFDYIESKVQHLRRKGLVSGKSTGRGRYGGAVPDAMKKDHEETWDRESKGSRRAWSNVGKSEED